MRKMRDTARLLVLGLVLILLSGSLIQTEQSRAAKPDWTMSIEHLLAEQEVELEQFTHTLQQAGDDLLADRIGQLRRAHMQELYNEAKALKAQTEEKLHELQADLNDAILQEQLKLMFVTLDEREQAARFKVIAQLQDQLASVRSDLEEELHEQLLELEAAYEERSQGEMALVRAEVERAMDDELAAFRLGLMQELEEEVAKLAPPSRSAMANR